MIHLLGWSITAKQDNTEKSE